jgi:hypothetical protein
VDEMRVIQIQYADPNKYYNKKSLERDLNISVRTIERYLLNDELEEKAIPVGKLKVYRGSDVNERIDEVLEGDKFVLVD